MFYAGLAGAAISLIIAIILYFKMQIAETFEDLTGLKLYKIKKRNEKSAAKEKSTERITKEIMAKKRFSSKENVAASEETELIQDDFDETALLDDETILLMDETALLGDEEETTLLTEEDEPFKKELDIIVVHSSMKL
jgi:hypothetical protein